MTMPHRLVVVILETLASSTTPHLSAHSKIQICCRQRDPAVPTSLVVVSLATKKFVGVVVVVVVVVFVVVVVPDACFPACVAVGSW